MKRSDETIWTQYHEQGKTIMRQKLFIDYFLSHVNTEYIYIYISNKKIVIYIIDWRTYVAILHT